MVGWLCRTTQRDKQGLGGSGNEEVLHENQSTMTESQTDEEVVWRVDGGQLQKFQVLQISRLSGAKTLK